MLLLRKTKTARARLCHDCGIALYRQMQSTTLLTGWWGIISFFTNIGNLWANFSARRELDALGPPRRPSAPIGQTPRSAPLPVGKPTLLRPQSIAFFAIVALLLVVFSLAGSQPSTSAGPLVGIGTCGSVDGNRVHYPLDCSDPAAAERIDAILPSTSTIADCPAPANGASHSAEYGLVCWEPV